MPTISLRLTDEQHTQLRAWAYGANRSLQREIIYRLFATLTERGERVGSLAQQPARGGKEADLRREEPDVHQPRSVSVALLSGDRRPRSGRCPHGLRAGVYCAECGQ